MLANLKIIWQFHAHPEYQKVSRFFGPRYIGDDFFQGRIQSHSIKLSFLVKSQKLTSAQKQKFLSVCQKRFNKLKNINIHVSKTSYQNDFYYTRGPGFSGIGRTREGTRLRITFALYVKKIFVSLVCYTERVYKVSNFFFRQYVQLCLSKNPKYTFYTIKSSLMLAY